MSTTALSIGLFPLLMSIPEEQLPQSPAVKLLVSSFVTVITLSSTMALHSVARGYVRTLRIAPNGDAVAELPNVFGQWRPMRFRIDDTLPPRSVFPFATLRVHGRNLIVTRQFLRHPALVERINAFHIDNQ